ncbi:MAG: hypothetical protein Kow0040_20750 [Thermogutta sp.]
MNRRTGFHALPPYLCGHPRRGKAWQRRCRHCGFTLLEVILSLALVTLVLAAMGAATVFHYRAVESAKARLAEAQLARAVLERMAQDIRGAVPYDPVNFAQLIPGLVTRTSESDLADAASAAGLDASMLFSEGGDSFSDLGDDAASGALPHSVPGLYGEIDWIQVDVSRLPRPDQLQSEIFLSADGMLIDRVSDVKTVTYFILDPAEASGYTIASTPGVTGFEQQGGLVRRELDRAVTAYLAESGELDQIDNTLQPIAPEVEAVEFAYFDGSSWTDSWDSDLQGTLPTAVEIRLYIRPAESRRDGGMLTGTLGAGLADEGDDLRMYRTVVYLPAAHVTGQLGATGGGTSESSGSQSGMSGDEGQESEQNDEMNNSPDDRGDSGRGGRPGGDSGRDRGGPSSGDGGGFGGPPPGPSGGPPRGPSGDGGPPPGPPPGPPSGGFGGPPPGGGGGGGDDR